MGGSPRTRPALCGAPERRIGREGRKTGAPETTKPGRGAGGAGIFSRGPTRLGANTNRVYGVGLLNIGISNYIV